MSFLVCSGGQVVCQCLVSNYLNIIIPGQRGRPCYWWYCYDERRGDDHNNRSEGQYYTPGTSWLSQDKLQGQRQQFCNINTYHGGQVSVMTLLLLSLSLRQLHYINFYYFLLFVPLPHNFLCPHRMNILFSDSWKYKQRIRKKGSWRLERNQLVWN